MGMKGVYTILMTNKTLIYTMDQFLWKNNILPTKKL